MSTYAVATPGGRVVACSSCKVKAATRFLQSSKRRNYCDACEPTDSSLVKRLVRYAAPPRAQKGAIVVKPTPAPTPKPAPDTIEQRVAALEKRVATPAQAADQDTIDELLEALDAETLVDAVRLAKELHTMLHAGHLELEKARADRETAELRFASGARLYREVEDKLTATQRELVKVRAELETATAYALEALAELPATANAAPPIDELARVLTGPTVTEPAVTIAPSTNGTHAPTATVVRTLREAALSEYVARIERAPGPPIVGVAPSADKAFRGLTLADGDRVRAAIERWLAGDGRMHHLTAALRKVPRYTKGRDLYGIVAGSLYVVAEKEGSAFTIVDVVARHELK